MKTIEIPPFGNGHPEEWECGDCQHNDHDECFPSCKLFNDDISRGRLMPCKALGCWVHNYGPLEFIPGVRCEMTKRKILVAKECAVAFLAKLAEWEADSEKQKNGYDMILYGTKYTAALRRASLDLTRSLAEMRKL